MDVLLNYLRFLWFLFVMKVIPYLVAPGFIIYCIYRGYKWGKMVRKGYISPEFANQIVSVECKVKWAKIHIVLEKIAIGVW